MRRILLSLYMLLFVTIVANAQTWLGTTTIDVNFREGPSTKTGIIDKLPINTVLYIDTREAEGDFYFALDVLNDQEGYVAKKYVKFYKNVEQSDGASIQPVAQNASSESVIVIRNKSDVTMTLRVNSSSYRFAPQETKTITMSPGEFTYRASSPGVIPATGKYTVDGGFDYDWEFWIRTTRR